MNTKESLSSQKKADSDFRKLKALFEGKLTKSNKEKMLPKDGYTMGRSEK